MPAPIGNVLLTDNVIAKEALMIVENNLTITKLINRRYEPKFAQDGNKIGDTLNIRLPVRWQGRTGETMTPEPAIERTIPLKIDQLIGQDLQFSNVDLTLKIDQFKERYLDTACASIANRIDQSVCAQYINCPNVAGVPGVVPAALDPYFDASVTLSNFGVPQGKRNIVISPRMEATIVNALKGLFQAASKIADQYTTGEMGHVIGFDWYMDQNIVAHTVGALGGAPAGQRREPDRQHDPAQGLYRRRGATPQAGRLDHLRRQRTRSTLSRARTTGNSACSRSRRRSARTRRAMRACRSSRRSSPLARSRTSPPRRQTARS